MGLSLDDILRMRSEVLDEGRESSRELGLDSTPTTELLLSSIARANRSVGRFASAYREKVSESERHETSLQRLTSFLGNMPCDSVDDAILAISESAVSDHSRFIRVRDHSRRGEERNHPESALRGRSVSRIEFKAGMPADIARDVLSRNRLERCGDPVRLRASGRSNRDHLPGLPVGSELLEFAPEPTLLTA